MCSIDMHATSGKASVTISVCCMGSGVTPVLGMVGDAVAAGSVGVDSVGG